MRLLYLKERTIFTIISFFHYKKRKELMKMPKKESPKRSQSRSYDIIIIGAGCAGLAGAMYAGRMQLRTLVLGESVGGTIILTDVVENYPGFIRLTGQELADKLKAHALDYKEYVELVEEKAVNVKKNGGCFEITSASGKRYMSKTLLIATGTKHRELGVPGEKEFTNKGVHTCALCDGAFYKGKSVAVVGGSDSAGKEALLLTQWAKKVYIIYRGETIHPEPINMQRVEQKIKEGKIEIINFTNVIEIRGDKKVTGVVLDKHYNGKKELPLDAVFVEIGLITLTELAQQAGIALNKKNEIIIDRDAQTNVPGAYAAGDITDTRFKQAITGAAEAVLAVYSAYTYINENALVCPTTDPNGNEADKAKKQKNNREL